MGVLKKSLQTWHRSADSRGARAASGVDNQSVLSGTEAEAESKDSIVLNATRKDESRERHTQRLATCSGSLGLCRLVSKTGLRHCQEWISKVRVTWFDLARFDSGKVVQENEGWMLLYNVHHSLKIRSIHYYWQPAQSRQSLPDR
jgi:hypothetical protein